MKMSPSLAWLDENNCPVMGNFSLCVYFSLFTVDTNLNTTRTFLFKI